MDIREMIIELGCNRTMIAKNANISVQQLNNAISQKRQAQKLADGRYVLVNKNATYFKKEENNG